jgi:Fe-S-cluster formation regulator IscX/YfhJ
LGESEAQEGRLEVALDRDWASGYLEQARADLLGAKAIGTASPSTAAMLWQMVFEKFAKAALLRQGIVSLANVRSSHRAASKMILFLRHQPPIFALLGGSKVWEDVLRIVFELEAAHPQIAAAHAPQLEYPWEDMNGVIQWPDRHLQVARALSDPTRGLGPRLLRFADLMSQQFDKMFP